MTFKQLQNELIKLSSASTAAALKRFFKTQKGEYASNDVFRGIYVPELRKIVRRITSPSFELINKLLHSKYHEDRMLGLLFLVSLYRKSLEDGIRQKIVKFYLKNSSRINSWDLVDLSAPSILGDYLLMRPKAILYKLAQSTNMWERRIAIVATLAFIRKNYFEDALKIAGILIADKENLIQKAVGWILREIGKRHKNKELAFLLKNIKKISGLTLSYATEKFLPSEKKAIYELYYAQKQGRRV